jgi:hypothetical protein
MTQSEVRAALGNPEHESVEHDLDGVAIVDEDVWRYDREYSWIHLTIFFRDQKLKLATGGRKVPLYAYEGALTVSRDGIKTTPRFQQWFCR